MILHIGLKQHSSSFKSLISPSKIILKFVKSTPLRVVFSAIFSAFHLVMKHCISCSIYYMHVPERQERMSLRIEQNRKWSNKTFRHTLCVVSTSDETTHCGICLTSNKNHHWASGSGGGRGVWAKNCILGDNFLVENWSFVR